MLGDIGFYIREATFSAVLSPRQRVLLVGAVAAVHALVLLSPWERIPSPPIENTLSATLLLTDTAPVHPVAPATRHPVAIEPNAMPHPVIPATPQAPLQQVAAPQVAAPQAIASQVATLAPASPAPSANAPIVTLPPDREPDYQASYLNNPKPLYPAMAAHMGWQGKVIVNVEVLTTGLAGQVSLQHSSGHETLDRAALLAVRNWRFLPARQNGQLVNKHFLIPIPFTLKDNDE